MDCRETMAGGRFLGLHAANGWIFAARPRARRVGGVLPVTNDGSLVLIAQFRTLVDSKIMASPWLAEARRLI